MKEFEKEPYVFDLLFEKIQREFMVKNVDFKFDKIPCGPDELWDVYYKDAKNDFRMYIKNINGKDCRIIYANPMEAR